MEYLLLLIFAISIGLVISLIHKESVAHKIPVPSFEEVKIKQELLDQKVQYELLKTEKDTVYSKMLELEIKLEEEVERNRVILSQKKSSEVRLGNTAEQLTAFLSACPYSPQDMHFLGQPLDFVVFNLDEGEVVFLEVKTGNAKLSKRQKTLKNIILSGRVRYAEMRIKDKGTKFKKFDNSEEGLEDDRQD